MADICDIFNKHGSDKDRNGYLQVYHSLFHKSRTDPISILEIGIESEGSLHAMQEYFPSGTIVGVRLGASNEGNEPFVIDNEPIDVSKLNTDAEAGASSIQPIKIYQCNITKSENVTDLFKKLATSTGSGSIDLDASGLPKGVIGKLNVGPGDIKFDIIIDSWSHNDLDQINTVRNFYPHLIDNGTYIIEGIDENSKITQCPSLIGCLCNHDSYFFAGLKNNMCVIQKCHLHSKRKNY